MSIRELRERKGFALFWWWRGWIAVALFAFRCGAPRWLVNGLGYVASLRLP
jgi:hypothetical protein